VEVSGGIGTGGGPRRRFTAGRYHRFDRQAGEGIHHERGFGFTVVDGPPDRPRSHLLWSLLDDANQIVNVLLDTQLRLPCGGIRRVGNEWEHQP
jgi:hypothetical protein